MNAAGRIDQSPATLFPIIAAGPALADPEAPWCAIRAAIDAGGIPLHLAKVNQIVREAPVEDTIARIKALLQT